MNIDVKRIIEEGHLGVRTYQNFVDACLERCAAGDEDAVSLFVVAKLVQPFSDYYLDHALTEPEAISFRERLLSYIAALEAAEMPEERLKVLRDVIQQELNTGLS
jgi:hypothetical protein